MLSFFNGRFIYFLFKCLCDAISSCLFENYFHTSCSDFCVLKISGLWGVLPIHPKTFIRARYNLKELEETKLKTHSLTSQSDLSEVEAKEKIEKEAHL